MKLIDEISLENVCGGHEIRDTIAIAGMAWIVCSVCAATSVFLIKDIEKSCNELKKYPKVDNNEEIYEITRIITINK